MKLKIILLSMLLLLLVSPALFAGCAKQEASLPQEVKGEIVIGLLDDLSGPIAGQGVPYTNGSTDAIRYINEEKGGILGHPLRGILVDHKMDGTMMLSGWERLKNEGVPVVICVTAVAAPILDAAAQDDHIPIVAGGGTYDQLYPMESSYFFANMSEFSGIIESMCKLIEKDWAAKGETGVPKIGIDLISIGTAPKIFGKATRMYVEEKRGWDSVTTLTSLRPVDVTTQVLQMKEAAVDYVYLSNVESVITIWLKELDRQGFYPQVYGSSALGTEEVWRAVGELAIGSIAQQPFVQWTDTDLPLVRLIRDLNAKWHPDVDWRPGYYCRGFTDLLVVSEALTRAVESAGYENLNGDTMKTAMETINDFDPMGIGTGFTWTPDDHRGIQGTRWYEWTEDGILKSVTDWDMYVPLTQEQKTQAYWITD